MMNASYSIYTESGPGDHTNEQHHTYHSGVHERKMHTYSTDELGQTTFKAHPSTTSNTWIAMACHDTRTKACTAAFLTAIVLVIIHYTMQFVIETSELRSAPAAEYDSADARSDLFQRVGQQVISFANGKSHSCYSALDVGVRRQHVVLVRNVNEHNSISERKIPAYWDSALESARAQGKAKAFMHMMHPTATVSNVTANGGYHPVTWYDVHRPHVSCFWMTNSDQQFHNIQMRLMHRAGDTRDGPHNKMIWDLYRLASGSNKRDIQTQSTKQQQTTLTDLKASLDTLPAELIATGKHHRHDAEVYTHKRLVASYANHVLVTYQDSYSGGKRTVSLFGDEAFCVQHYMDILRHDMICTEMGHPPGPNSHLEL